jgi:hypothetical protein
MKARRFRPKKTGNGFWSVIDVFTGEVVVLHDIEVAWLEDKDEADDTADLLNHRDEERWGVLRDT